MPEVKRECGSCTYCCKTMGVRELNKPEHKWCEHCSIGKGCNIYSTRPASCKEFECLWLSGLAPEELRPDKSHIVLDTTSDGQKIICHIDPMYPNAHENSAAKRYIDGLYKNRIDVVLVTGDKRKILLGKGNSLPYPFQIINVSEKSHGKTN